LIVLVPVCPSLTALQKDRLSAPRSGAENAEIMPPLRSRASSLAVRHRAVPP
jgi:hypothetical protein